MEPVPDIVKDRSQWTARKVHSFEEAEKLHIQDWQNVSGAERVAAWEMVVEAWKLKKRDRNELRFQRVARCLKRKKENRRVELALMTEAFDVAVE